VGVSVSTATPESSLIVTLYPLLQRFNVPSQIVVVASASCQTCVAMHGSIQMPWSIRRPKENVPTRPVLRAPIPTPSVKICHRHVAQDGEPVSHAGAYPVVAAPALSLDRALQMILIWKWPKRGSHLLYSHLPAPVDPHISRSHISRSHTFPLLVRLLFPMWDLSTLPSLESVHLAIVRWWGMPPSLATLSPSHEFSAQQTAVERLGVMVASLFARSASLTLIH